MPEGFDLGNGYITVAAEGDGLAADFRRIFSRVEQEGATQGRGAVRSFLDGVRDGIRAGRGQTDRAVSGVLDGSGAKADDKGRASGRGFIGGMRDAIRRDGRDVERAADAVSSRAGRSAGDEGKKAGKRFGSGMTASILKGAAVLGAGQAVFGFLKDSISEARESQKVGAVTTQIIKATGGAAKISADQVGDLATAISNKTGVDDEAIQSGSNLLLTFKNVRNEAGKGAAIFDRATQAAVDLSAAGFGSIEGSSKMLGKALNDPLKGISALGRAGVTFTAQQKEQIKTLVKSGDTLSAQKIILKEVESQVGGVAAKSATAGEKFATTFGNFKEAVGNSLLPVLDVVLSKGTEVLGWLTTGLGPAFRRVGEIVGPAFETIKTGVSAFFAALEEGDVTSDGFVGFLETIGDFLHRVLPPAIEVGRQAFAAISAFIRDEVIPRLAGIGSAVKGFVDVALPIVTGFVSGMIARISPLMPQIREVFSTIGAVITGALDLIKAVIGRVTAVISFIWTKFGSHILTYITNIWRMVTTLVQGALGVVRGIIQTVTSLIKGDWSGAWDGVKQIFSSAWRAIVGFAGIFLDQIKNMLSAAWTAVRLVAGAAWSGITGVVSTQWGKVTAKVGAVLTGIKAALKGAWTALKASASSAWGGIVTAVSAAWSGLTGAISGPIERAKQFIQENLINRVNSLFAAVGIDFRIGTIWTASRKTDPNYKVSNLAYQGSRDRNANRLGGFASGGVLPGYTPGRDVHRFVSMTGGTLDLSGGEGILIPQATRGLGGPAGIKFINDMFRRGGQAFAQGGVFRGPHQAFADGGVFGAIKSVVSGLKDLVTDPIGALKRLFSTVLGAVGSNPFAKLTAGMVGKTIGGIVARVQSLWGAIMGGGGSGAVAPGAVLMQGHRLDSDTARRVAAAGRASGVGMQIIQGSWSHNPLSRGTHAGAGAADLKASNWNGGVSALRQQGLLAMFRNWPGNRHIHLLNPNIGGLSSQALAQVRRARANGGIFAGGGVFTKNILQPQLNDRGSIIPMGDTLVRNQTRGPETLLPRDLRNGMLTDSDIARLAKLLAASQVDYQSLAQAIGEHVERGARRGVGDSSALARRQNRQQMGVAG